MTAAAATPFSWHNISARVSQLTTSPVPSYSGMRRASKCGAAVDIVADVDVEVDGEADVEVEGEAVIAGVVSPGAELVGTLTVSVDVTTLVVTGTDTAGSVAIMPK